MATKARFYEVTVKNGFGEEKHIVNAPKKSLIGGVFENKNVKVTNISYLGFKKVEAQLDEDRENVEFSVPELNNLTIRRGEVGYNSLTQTFDNKVKGVQEIIEQIRNE